MKRLTRELHSKMVLDVFFCESHVGTQDESHQFYQNRGAFKTLRIHLGMRVNFIFKKF